MKDYCLMDTGFQFCEMKDSRDLFHNNVNVFNTTELKDD